MAVKKNPFIDSLTKQIQKKYQLQLDAAASMDAIAMMKTVHEELGVGPGRAGRVFFAYQNNREELARTFLNDYGADKDTGDKNMLHTKSTYAKFLKGVFGQTVWDQVKIFFIILRDYW